MLVSNEELSGEGVPLVLEVLIDYLQDQSYNHPKLFLLPGNNSEIYELKDEMENRGF